MARPKSNATQSASILCLFFFFQAEDGIRDLTVTGVQTCALPISRRADRSPCPWTWLDARSRDKASGRLYERLFIRHWNTWSNGTRSHLFSAPLSAGGAASATPVDVSKGFDAGVPGKPFGGDEDFAFSPDGRSLVFSGRRSDSLPAARSRRSARHASAWCSRARTSAGRTTCTWSGRVAARPGDSPT